MTTPITCTINTPSAQIVSTPSATPTLTSGKIPKASTLNTLVDSAITENTGNLTTTKPIVLPAGTATAGSAPLKFVAGTKLGTPEAGAMEFADGRWYVTGTAKQIALDRTCTPIVATTTVANTVTETTLFTESLSANAMKVERIYKIHIDGIISTASAADDATFNFYLGSTLYVTSAPAMGAITNAVWCGDYEITIRTTGASGTSALHRTLCINGVESEVSSLQAVDTTVANAITFKIQWNNAKAGNTISIYQGWVELKN